MFYDCLANVVYYTNTVVTLEAPCTVRIFDMPHRNKLFQTKSLKALES